MLDDTASFVVVDITKKSCLVSINKRNKKHACGPKRVSFGKPLVFPYPLLLAMLVLDDVASFVVMDVANLNKSCIVSKKDK